MIKISFKCIKCGRPSKLPISELADYYASEQTGFLQCWQCMPVRSKAPSKITGSAMLIQDYAAMVDKWTKAKRKKKVRV